MAKFECKVCSYIYNEQQAGRPFDELTECPICNEDKSNFKMLEEEEVFFEWADEEDNIIDVEVRPIDEEEEPSADDAAAPEVIESAEPTEETEVLEETPVVEEVTATEEVTVTEAFDSGVVSDVEEKQEEEADAKETEETPLNPAAALMKDLETAKDINTEYVVERRQEFWSPFSGTKTEKADKEEAPVKKAWSIENAYASVERVLDLNGNEVKPEIKESVEELTDNVVQEVGTSEEVLEEKEEELKILTTTEGYLDDDMEEVAEEATEEAAEEVVEETAEEAPAFKPLWQGGAEELPRVEEPLEAKAENVFKVEAPAGTVAEEIAEDVVAEAIEEEKAEVTEEVTEEVAEETTEEVNEEVAEEVTEEAAEVTEEAAEEAAEEAVGEVIEEVAEEVTEEVNEEVAEEATEEAAEEVTEEAAEEVTEEVNEEVAEEVTEEATEEVIPVFVASPEIVEKLKLNEEFFEDIVTELPDDELIITPDGTEPLPIPEEVEEDVIEEPVEEVVEDKFNFGDLDDVEESASNEVEEIYIETVEDPDKKWTFNNSMSNTLKGQESNAKRYEFIAKELGENVVVEEKEEVVEAATELLEEAKEEVVAAVPVADEKAVSLVEEVKDEKEVVAATVPCKKEASGNGLEDIMILPAQLSPMPLDGKAVVETATVIGLGAERPLLLEQPVIKSNVKKVVEYAPNKGLTSEDFQAADVIEIIVGRGDGIEKTISSKEDLRQAVAFLRLESDGCPIGIKLAAGRIERDLEFCVFAKPDFVVMNKFTVVPLPYALYRAKKYLNNVQSDIDLVIELKDVADAEEAAKVIAMGADVVVLKDSDKDMDALNEQLKQIAKETGNYEVSDLNVQDLCTTNREIAQYTDIYHV